MTGEKNPVQNEGIYPTQSSKEIRYPFNQKPFTLGVDSREPILLGQEDKSSFDKLNYVCAKQPIENLDVSKDQAVWDPPTPRDNLGTPLWKQIVLIMLI